MATLQGYAHMYTHLNFLYTVGEAGKVLANHWYAITKIEYRIVYDCNDYFVTTLTRLVVTVSKTMLSQCGDNVATRLPLCSDKITNNLYKQG